jgi:hypothetical protein
MAVHVNTVITSWLHERREISTLLRVYGTWNVPWQFEDNIHDISATLTSKMIAFWDIAP